MNGDDFEALETRKLLTSSNYSIIKLKSEVSIKFINESSQLMGFKVSYSNGNLSVGSPSKVARFSGLAVNRFSEHMNFMSVATNTELTILDTENDSVIFNKKNDN